MNSRFARSSRLAALGLSVLNAVMAASQTPPLNTTRPTWSELNPVTRLTAETFSHPPASDRPWVRVNTPDNVTSEELKAEIIEMKRSGIGGLEIGQGTFPKTPQLIAILQAANEAGLKVSLSHGSTVSPAGYSFNEDNVRKTLLFTASKVSGGQTADITLSAPLPPANTGFGGGPRAAAPPAPRRSTLIAVLAYRCAESACSASDPISLDAASVVDLTSTLTAIDKSGVAGGPTTGHLKWEAPAAGQWQIIALWSQGVFAQPDLFSKQGTDELIRGMETDWTPEVKALLKQNGGDIFYDSHSSDRGSPTELWTNNMETEFKTRRGYSLLQSAPALFEKNFTFSDGSAPRVRNDLNAVRGELWIEDHIKPMEAWAHTFNYRIRLQPYGEPVSTTPDEIEAASALDRPETESLFFGDDVDSYRPIASANHVTGNTWFSTECCAALGKAYAQTFQDAVIRMHRSYVGGVTKLVYHVYPYRDAADAKWPGYHSFGPAGFANAWGPRNPFWIDAPAYNDYLARTQQVLTQGEARVDVAVYMQSYLYPAPMFIKGGFHIWPDTGLQEAGYTHDYLDPTLLAMADPTDPTDPTHSTLPAGHVAIGKPAYKAFIIDSEQQPATDPIRTSMPVDAARRILALAKAGLPIIIVGSAPNQTPGRTPADDATLQALMSDLMQNKNVHQVKHEADVPALLVSLGIHPAMEPGSPSPALSVRRRDASRHIDYYFFYNEGMVTPPNEPGNLFEPAEGKTFDQEVHLQGDGKPYRMDAWTGKITPIENFAATKDGVTFHLNIAPDDAAIVAISTSSLGIAPTAPKAGTVASLPAPINLTHSKWHLSVEDWQPANEYATTGRKATETRKEVKQLDIEELKPWPQIPLLKDVSGIGTYTVGINLPSGWKIGTGARLDLGEVFDSFTLSVNGSNVPVNQISATVEIGPYLHAGANTLVVRVATTLNNRLSSLDPAVAKRGLIQEYGLIGPVVLTPHNQ
jgi:glycosyl hydrolase family 106( putative alpha-L-rhamnosidase)